MTMTRPRKARMLEKSGLQYVAAWLPKQVAEDLQPEIEATESRIEEILAGEKP